MPDCACGLVVVGVSETPTPDLSLPTLLLEGDEEKFQILRAGVERLPTSVPVQIRKTLIADEAGLSELWYRFNDSRCNGPIPVESWQRFFPNLKLQTQQSLISETLAGILDEWAQEQGALEELILIVRQGNPNQILAGAQHWLTTLREFHLAIPKAKEMWQESIDAWMNQNGFRRRYGEKLVWERNPLSSKVQQLRSELNSMKEALKSNERQHPSAREEERRLKEEIEQLQYPSHTLKSCLESVFPYDFYRENNPDLRSFSNSQLLEHFHQQASQQAPGSMITAFTLERQALIKERDELRHRLANESTNNHEGDCSLRSEAPTPTTEEKDLLSLYRTILLEVFPCNLYRRNHNELQEYSDEQIVDHYALSNRSEEAREQLKASLNESAQALEKLKELRQQLEACREQHTKLESQQKAYKISLEHIFPHSVYRRIRVDLNELQDEQLAEHFTFFGIHEGVELSSDKIWSENESLKEERHKLQEQLQALNENQDRLHQKLSILKDVCERLSVAN